MAIEVKVPSMGESITSGILSAWLVKDGDFVEKDPLEGGTRMHLLDMPRDPLSFSIMIGR